MKSTDHVPQNYVNSSQQGPVNTFAKSETVVIDSGSQYPMLFSQPIESVNKLNVGDCKDEPLKKTNFEGIPTKISSKMPAKSQSRRKYTSRNPEETSLNQLQSDVPEFSKRVPNILRRNKKVRVQSSEKQEPKIQSPKSETVVIDSGNQYPKSFSRSIESVDKLNVDGSLKKTSSKAMPTNVSSRTPVKGKKRRKCISRDHEETSSKQQSDVPKCSKRVPNILQRNEKFGVKSPEKEQAKIIQTPPKNTAQSTLAEINCSNSTPRSRDVRVDDFTNIFSARGASPLGHNRSFEFLRGNFGSPGISPLRTPVCFSSGFTPPRQGDCEPEFLSTPIRSCLGDLSFNWTPLLRGLTPMSNNTSNSNCASNQRCRKSLALEQINELNESTPSKATW